ncbi:O-antigen ligase family protein [Priestia aryabhattai]|uniref:O-antigen ligase family protein n=1 Tax=Priestia aryabhattai TaxID=412384 RepID=UPI001C8E3A6E|nr:O-antigen ligase family protein [Priestia aryabhattai]MBX9993187.1 O-antigen ligase family protein [Priestia aryabhattai]
MRIVVKYFLITLGMVSAFSLHAWLPIPLFLGIVGLLLLLVIGIKKNYKIIFNKEDLFLVLLLLFVFTSLTLNDISRTNINHAMAFFMVLFVYYFGVRSLIFNLKLEMKFINKAIFIGVIISSLYAIFEFSTKNYIPSLSFVNEYIYRPAVQDYTPLYNGSIIRARSFTEESGVFALYLNAFAPVGLLYVKERYKTLKFYFLVFLVAISYLFSFSAGGIGFLLSSIFLCGLLWLVNNAKNLRVNIKKASIFFYVTLVFIIIISMYINQIISFLYPLLDKITLENDSGRFARWQMALSLFKDANWFQYFIGVGPGQVSEVFGTGTTSFYIDRLVENGVFGLACFLAFISMIYMKLNKLQTNRKYVYFISLTSVLLHYFIISNYWFPFLWIIIIIIQLESWKGKVENV